MIEIEWYKIYEGDKARSYNLINENWKKFEINMEEYSLKLLWKTFPTRLEERKAFIEVLPKELPYKVREFLVF